MGWGQVDVWIIRWFWVVVKAELKSEAFPSVWLLEKGSQNVGHRVLCAPVGGQLGG